MCTPIKQKGRGHWVFNCALKARKKCNFREVLNIFFIVIYRQPKIGISQIWSKQFFKNIWTFFITHFFQFLKHNVWWPENFFKKLFLAFSWPFSPEKRCPAHLLPYVTIVTPSSNFSRLVEFGVKTKGVVWRNITSWCNLSI